jgi:hypothetical protein
MRLKLSMSFSNLFSTSETLLDEDSDTAESSMFTSSKLHVTETADEALTNLSQLSDKQHVLHSQEDFKKTEIFLT